MQQKQALVIPNGELGPMRGIAIFKLFVDSSTAHCCQIFLEAFCL
jgi:hypothetical protein